ncbi:MAG: RsmB/NOP family class I SAM-dependent RNA methyltransferase [Pseudomonadota bacterium]
MKPGARIRAAIEVIEQISEHHQTAARALSDWGKSHRFAGSGDRSAIGTIVYGALRRRNSIAAAFGDDTPRALALGAADKAIGLSAQDLAKAADGSVHSIEPLNQTELSALATLAEWGTNRVGTTDTDQQYPSHVLGDFPDWLTASVGRAFGDRAVPEMMALANRAPIDLRVNALKADREKLLHAFSKYQAETGPIAPNAVRLPVPPSGKRAPNVEAETAHGKGWFEIQDAGSQIAAAIAAAKPREQVLDLCAGAGGKTLALAAAMHNTGQIYAYDRDRVQLRPIFERLKRAGVRNVQVMDAADTAARDQLQGRFDLVLVDAPCTGSGTWRRKPDAKWRLSQQAMDKRITEQQAALADAAPMVRLGGRLVYVTCSVFAEENVDQVRWFVEQHKNYKTTSIAAHWAAAFPDGPSPQNLAIGPDDIGVQLSPARTSTDGFYIAVLQRTDEPG